MSHLICPVCRRALISGGKSMRCENGHTYDIAKQGYVNLLMSNKASVKRHGDDRAMVRARTAFLEKGYYNCLRDAVCRAAVDHFSGESAEVTDVGCGEGWYTEAVKQALFKAGKGCAVCGIDISRDALIGFSRRDREAVLAVASVNSLPIADRSQDIIINLFAPCDGAEFLRVLKPGGVVIRAVPMEDHLWGLKKAIYDKPYLNSAPEYSLPGADLLERIEIKDKLTLTGKEDIASLFLMTPYYYKTSREDQQKLESLDRLETEISFCVFVMRKK